MLLILCPTAKQRDDRAHWKDEEGSLSISNSYTIQWKSTDVRFQIRNELLYRQGENLLLRNRDFNKKVIEIVL